MLVSECGARRERRSLLFLALADEGRGGACAPLKLLWIFHESLLFHFKSGLWKRFIAASCRDRGKGDIK
jgi:hypothetical protein